MAYPTAFQLEEPAETTAHREPAAQVAAGHVFEDASIGLWGQGYPSLQPMSSITTGDACGAFCANDENGPVDQPDSTEH
jgi:hypothetical protein